MAAAGCPRQAPIAEAHVLGLSIPDGPDVLFVN